MGDRVAGSSDTSPSPQASSRTLTIEFSKPEVVAPVFVAGTFTAWTPIEMQLKPPAESSSEKPAALRFFKTFDNVSEGEQQYKFRLGNGDSWALDEKTKIAIDEHGNQNNVVIVPSSEPATKTPLSATASIVPVAKDPNVSQSANNSAALTQPGSVPQEPLPAVPKQGMTNEIKDAVKPIQPNLQPFQTQGNQPVKVNPAVSASDSATANMTEKPPPTHAVDDQGKSGTASPASLPAEAASSKLTTAAKDMFVQKDDVKPTEPAKVAAEVADSAAKLDSSPPRRTGQEPDQSFSVFQTPKSSVKNDIRRMSKTEATFQAIADAVSTKANGPSNTPAESSSAKQQESLSSPSVPPAPAVTPVAFSPPLTPEKLESLDSSHSVPSASTAASPKSLESLAHSPEAKKPVEPGTNENANGVTAKSVPPTTPIKRVEEARANAKLPMDTPSAAAQIPLPPTPAPEATVGQVDNVSPGKKDEDLAEEPMPGDYPASPGQNASPDGSGSIVETLKAFPGTVQALLASIIRMITSWVAAAFGSRPAGQDKGSKSD